MAEERIQHQLCIIALNNVSCSISVFRSELLGTIATSACRMSNSTFNKL